MAMPQDLEPVHHQQMVGDVSVFFDDHVTLVRLAGEIDIGLAEDLEAAGRDVIDRGFQVRMDLSQVTFMDSVGLAFVARAAAAGLQRGRRLELTGAPRVVRELLHASGVAGLVDHAGHP